MRRIITIALCAIEALAVMHAIICDNPVDIIIYSFMGVICMANLSHWCQKPIGILLCGIAAGLVHFHVQLCYIFFALGLVTLGGYFYANMPFYRTAQKATSWILLACGFYALFESGILQAAYLQSRERHIAVLNRGVWGVEQPRQHSLNITGQYSYDLVRDSIGAELINDISSLDKYTDLLLITPTTPFSSLELDKLEAWVSRGGHLVVITDHTDLFGHVRAITPLLDKIGVEARKDSIIERDAHSCLYFSLTNSFSGLTSNSFRGKGTAFLWQIGFSEHVDYASPSFFSDNQVADDDMAGIYVVGLNRVYNRGIVTLFGDSTMFSNFAFAFPSSQQILKLLLSPICVWNLHLFIVIIVFSFLICSGKVPTRLALLGASIITMIPFLMRICANERKLQPTKTRVVPVYGDRLKIEEEGSRFRTLFASAYSYGILPVWKGENDMRDELKIGSHRFAALSEFGSLWDSTRNSIDVLSSTCTCQLHDYICGLIEDSNKSSFWFDSGAGPLREYAYGLFWASCTDAACPSLPEFEKEDIRNVLLILSGGYKLETTTYLKRAVSGEASWVILGDWVLGKMIDESTVLIRAIWQHPSWSLGDCVVELQDTPKH